jgi:uncharacterized protein (TIGR03435 family)
MTLSTVTSSDVACTAAGSAPSRPGINGGGTSSSDCFHHALCRDHITALQEQLGLKLVAARGAVDVLIVDRIERPIED